MHVAASPSGHRGGVADPLWRTSDTLDMPGYENDRAVLDAELEDALASQQDINIGTMQMHGSTCQSMWHTTCIGILLRHALLHPVKSQHASSRV